MGSTISSIENSFSLADYAAIKNGILVVIGNSNN